MMMTPLRGIPALQQIANSAPTAESVGLSDLHADWREIANRLWRSRLGWPAQTRALTLELRKRTLTRGGAIDTARADLILLDVEQYERNWKSASKTFASELKRVFQAGGDARWGALAAMHRARGVMFDGEREEAHQRFERWLADSAGMDERDRAWVQGSLGLLQTDNRQEAEGFRNLHEALEHLRAVPASPELVMTLMNLGVAHVRFGNFRTAEGIIEEALGIADGMPGFERLNLLAANWARCATQLGEAERAVVRLAPLVDRRERPFDRAYLDVMMADAQRRCGQLEAARESLERASSALEGARPGSPSASVMRTVRLGLLRQQGRLQEAQAALADAEANPPGYISHVYALDLYDEAAKLQAALGNWDKAYEYERRHHRQYVEVRRIAERMERLSLEAQHALFRERVEREFEQRQHEEAEQARARLANLKSQLAGRIEEVRSLQVALREGTIRDAQTGLHNRHFLEETLAREVSRASPEFPSVLVVLELDSPEAGRQPEDRELQAFAHLLRDETQGTDLAFRYEGLVFCWLLGDTDVTRAQQRCNALQERFGGLRFGAIPHAPKTRFSFCAGLAEAPRQGKDANELLALADAALYRARLAGPGHIMVAVDASA
jgi:diguanylate cyclase (GGDEF)-like protein